MAPDMWCLIVFFIWQKDAHQDNLSQQADE